MEVLRFSEKLEFMRDQQLFYHLRQLPGRQDDFPFEKPDRYGILSISQQMPEPRYGMDILKNC